MRFFLDTEFIERGAHHPIEMISIGLVDENNREYYAVSKEFLDEDLTSWHHHHVVPQLGKEPRKLLSEIRHDLRTFLNVGAWPHVEFWANYAAYDWVVLCQVFGRMVDLPPGSPVFCHDIQQWRRAMGNPQLPRQREPEHNALNDARYARDCYVYLHSLQGALQRERVPALGARA